MPRLPGRQAVTDVSCVPSRERHKDAYGQLGLWPGYVGEMMLESGLEVLRTDCSRTRSQIEGDAIGVRHGLEP